MEKTKICKKCGKELPLECFGKNKCKKDGLQSWCKECFKQYYTVNREHELERNKQYRVDNIEARKQYDKQYRADNAEAIKEKNKQWRADNVEHIKQYSKQYHKQLYSTIEGYARVIRNTNLREDRKHGRCGKDEDPLPSIEEYIELLQQPDFYDGKQYHWSEMGIDRIDNSKPHTIDNVVPCTTEHNRQRHTKTFEEFRNYIHNSF